MIYYYNISGLFKEKIIFAYAVMHWINARPRTLK